MSWDLPKITSRKKAIVTTDNQLRHLLNIIKEDGYSTKHLLAVFGPDRVVWELHNEQDPYMKEQRQLALDAQVEKFVSECEEYGVEYRLYKTYEDYTLPNGDNYLSDHMRVDSFAGMLNRLEADGVKLGSYHYVITSTRKVVFELLDVGERVNSMNESDLFDYIQTNCPALIEEYPQFIMAVDYKLINEFMVKTELTGLKQLVNNEKVYFPFRDLLEIEVKAL